MRYNSRFLMMTVMTLALSPVFASDFPAWAYPVNPAGVTPPPRDEAPRHVPNSTAAFTQQEIGALTVGPPDWHPSEHPAMTGIVGHSREPRVYACAYCHLPNGAGRPENSSLAGLSVNYIKAQLAAFKEGRRVGSEPRRLPHTLMSGLSRELTESEIETSAAYFASLPHVSFTKVIESATAPRTAVASWMLKALPDTEPIGQRIVEVAEDFQRFENRDSRTPYLAYVPVGSIARGAQLVVRKSPQTQACGECHGSEFQGVADVPRLAGRSPSYLFRQLYDFREGKRGGAAADLMKPIVAGLSDEELVAIAAFLASRTR